MLVVGAALLWGTTGTAQQLGPDSSNPATVGALRLLVGGAVLVIIALATRRLRPFAPGNRIAALVCALGIAAYQVTFFAAVARTGVAVGTVVAIGSAPILAAMLGWIVLGERVGVSWVKATTLAITGVYLMVGTSGSVDATGVGLALGAGASYAVYAAGSKQMMRSFHPLGAMAVGFGGGALLLLPFLAAGDTSWLGDPGAWPMVIWLGVATVGLAYVLFGYGLRSTDVGVAATISLAEPLVAALLGLVVLSERPTTLEWLGMAAVVGGLAISVSAPSRMPLRTGPRRRQRPREHGR